MCDHLDEVVSTSMGCLVPRDDCSMCRGAAPQFVARVVGVRRRPDGTLDFSDAYTVLVDPHEVGDLADLKEKK